QHGINLPFMSNAFRRTLSLALSRPLLAALVIGVLPVMGFIAANHPIDATNTLSLAQLVIDFFYL
ncbi:hypothetical protein, partial [Shewanella sairae]|uniref:hypothetical protein n=1 Tax=Shewanella sairae TaxID=190310 RepID=UPI001C819B81